MKTLLIIILSLLGILNIVKGQVSDSAYYGNKNYRAVMGGGEKVHADTITPLAQIIQRLDSPWEFVVTFKAYWIGYTDDMYSIANYKEKLFRYWSILLIPQKILKRRKVGYTHCILLELMKT